MTPWRKLLGLVLVSLVLAAACSTTSPKPGQSVTDTTLPPTPPPSVPLFTPPSGPSITPVSVPIVSSPPPPTTPTPAPSARPATALHRFTSGGCCVQPYWSADSRQVRFIDRPSSGQPAGIWGVSVSGGAPVLVTTRVGIYSADETLVAYLEGRQTYVEKVGGPRWAINDGGRAVSFSPDSQQIAWQVAGSLYDFDRRRVQIWVARVDGSGARKVVDLIGGSLAGWFPDSQRLLVTSRDGDHSQVQVLNLADNSLSVLASAPRLSNLALSAGGGWLAYEVAFSGDASQDGLWVVPVNQASAEPPGARRLDVFGGFAWRGEGRLLVIPLDAAADRNRVMEVDAATGASRMLNDPAASPFLIAQGEWALAPDGGRLAFVSAADHNIWVLDLTE